MNYQPPESAKNNASRVIEWKRKHGDDVKGMTNVGWARAYQLASGKPISLDTVKRMAQFNRHRKNANVDPKYKNEPWKDAGYVAWLGWGGDSGVNWAMNVSENSTKSLLERAKHLSESHNQATHAHSSTNELVTALLRMPSAARKAAINALPPKHKKAVEDAMSVTTTKPGDKYNSIKNPRVYEALIRQGYDKSRAAAISNAQVAGGKKKKKVATKTSFTVFKQQNGRYRWVAISSNAYRDRDGEIVSKKALENDVIRADNDRDYGPLRFWHMPGIDIGDCDFNMMRSRSLIESGTFHDEAIGEKLANSPEDYQLSIGFKHPPNEPVQGVFHNIRRFERSLVPAGKAANPFTSLIVHKESKMNDTEKLQALKALLDGDEARLKALVSRVDSTEKQADAMGIAFKEVKDLSTLNEDELLEYAIAKKEAAVKAATEKKKVEIEVGEEEDEEEENMAEKGYMTEMKAMMTDMKGMMSKFEKMLGERESKKEDTTSALKEAQDANNKRIAELEKIVKETTEDLKIAQKELGELKSNAPTAVLNGVRPTERTDNITAEKSANGVSNSPLAEFVSWGIKPPQS